jgi:hypothetical protein
MLVSRVRVPEIFGRQRMVKRDPSGEIVAVSSNGGIGLQDAGREGA